MLFRTIEHYPCFENDDYLEKECLICYNNIQHNFIMQNTYNFDCDCYKLIHLQCLQMWYDKNKTCPICRKYIIKKPNYKFEIIKMFITILLITDALIKFTTFICFIYLLIIIFNIFIMSIKLLLF
jgi:hypothetical protein